MKTIRLMRIAASLFTVLGLGCASAPPPAVATAVGTSAGTVVSLDVGPSGGTVTSGDGRLAVVIPAGALAASTAITVEPITNQAFGGVGLAYRLGPQGQTFTAPVQLVFHYTDADLVGSVPEALLAAVQTADGYWELLAAADLDDTQKTLSSTTTHFSDYSLVEDFQVAPAMATVKVGNSLPIRITNCYPVDRQTPGKNRGFPCTAGYLSVGTGAWSVNGVRGGDGTNGTVSGNNTQGTFTAPAAKPTPDTVAVSTEVSYANIGQRRKLVLISQVTIASSPTHYTGTATFTLPNASGTAYVEDWAQFEDLGDTRRYLPSGHMVIDFHMPDCAPLHQQYPLSTSTADTPHETLTLYADSNAAFPKHYMFALSGNGTVTLQCGTPPAPQTFPVAGLTAFVVGVCGATGVEPMAYTDEARLAGSYNCVDAQLTTNWEFLGQ